MVFWVLFASNRYQYALRKKEDIEKGLYSVGVSKFSLFSRSIFASVGQNSYPAVYACVTQATALCSNGVSSPEAISARKKCRCTTRSGCSCTVS